MDNAALAAACADSKRVVPVFVFDTNILDDLENRHDRRVSFIHASLTRLRETLNASGSDLVVLHGDPLHEIPSFASRLNADAVYTNRDYEPYAKVRDETVRRMLSADGRAFHSFKDHVVFEGDEVLTAAGKTYSVFTPYKRAWLQRLENQRLHAFPPDLEHPVSFNRLASRRSLMGFSVAWGLTDLGFEEVDNVPNAGETGAREALERFLPRLKHYHDERDFPMLDATSRLSVHLRFGTISIRELLRTAIKHDSSGSRVWLSELIWREFYQMILDRLPGVVNHAFRERYDNINWPGSDEHFKAWCEGRTGYPIVDAAMRHFNNTGWMHNRLRMIVAMFLTKDLLVDWRLGERYFADNLLDYDLASNNGGWQWSASTGVDAAPYFRVFNPVLQSKRFDPGGEFIRAQLPELRGFSEKHIHWPHDADAGLQRRVRCILGMQYPHPVVNHAEQKEKALALFRGL